MCRVEGEENWVVDKCEGVWGAESVVWPFCAGTPCSFQWIGARSGVLVSASVPGRSVHPCAAITYTHRSIIILKVASNSQNVQLSPYFVVFFPVMDL